MSMNKKWLSSGRYGITRGINKRLWEFRPSLSVVIITPIVFKKTSGGVLLAESQNPIKTESDIRILSESVMVE